MSYPISLCEFIASLSYPFQPSTSYTLTAPRILYAMSCDQLFHARAASVNNGGTPTGHSLLLNPAKVTIVGRAGSSGDQSVDVTNTGASQADNLSVADNVDPR